MNPTSINDSVASDTTTDRPSTKRTILVAATAFAVAAAAAAATIISGIIPMGRNHESLPCNDLTSYQSTQQAYDGYRTVIDELVSVGDDVEVTVKHADCPAQSQDVGYIEVVYGDDAEQDGIMTILEGNDLGAYIALIRR